MRFQFLLNVDWRVHLYTPNPQTNCPLCAWDSPYLPSEVVSRWQINKKYFFSPSYLAHRYTLLFCKLRVHDCKQFTVKWGNNIPIHTISKLGLNGNRLLPHCEMQKFTSYKKISKRGLSNYKKNAGMCNIFWKICSIFVVYKKSIFF